MGLRSLTTRALPSFDFIAPDGSQARLDDIPAPLSVTGTESCLDGVRLGLGLAQMPLFHVARDLAQGRLERVLAGFTVPSAQVSVLYPRSRQLSPRVRLFIDWVVQQFARAAAQAHPGQDEALADEA